jgi:hypothetical protein
MKLNSAPVIGILMVVLAICGGALLSGCASTGGTKEAGTDAESPQTPENRSAALKQTSGSGSEVRKVPAISTGGSLKSDQDGFEPIATSLKQGTDRKLTKTQTGTHWNAEVIAVVGILAMSLLYWLAFRLARRPLRRQGASLRRGGVQTGDRSPREPAYRTS